MTVTVTECMKSGRSDRSSQVAPFTASLHFKNPKEGSSKRKSGSLRAAAVISLSEVYCDFVRRVCVEFLALSFHPFCQSWTAATISRIIPSAIRACSFYIQRRAADLSLSANLWLTILSKDDLGSCTPVDPSCILFDLRSPHGSTQPHCNSYHHPLLSPLRSPQSKASSPIV